MGKLTLLGILLPRLWDSLGWRGGFEVAQGMVAVLAAKDGELYGHSCRVAQYSLWISQALRLPGLEVARLQQAALLHDIGKLCVPEKILTKPDRLTAEEWNVIKKHPIVSEQIVTRAPRLCRVAPLVRGHHERFDGSGYPDGLAGEEIPLACRILAVADAFDAMTFDRPYRKAYSIDRALAELEDCAGSQFDPALVAALLRVTREKRGELEKMVLGERRKSR